jgi:hypothetical protein
MVVGIVKPTADAAEVGIKRTSLREGTEVEVNPRIAVTKSEDYFYCRLSI